MWTFQPAPDRRLAPLRNALGSFLQPLARRELLELWNLALQTGPVDPPLLAWFHGLWLRPSARGVLGALAEAPPVSLEVQRQRNIEPGFQWRLEALRQHAQPGDLLFWGSPELGWPWNFMRSVYGPWMHVSLVLSQNAWLDPYWPEGVVILRPEDVTAKAARRIRATEVVIARPRVDWDAGCLESLRARAVELYGLPYGLMGTPDEVLAAVSCSRAAWAVLRAAGLDLLAGRERLFSSSITPRDIFKNPYLHIRADGSVSNVSVDAEPAGFAGEVVRRAEKLFSAFPLANGWVRLTGPVWTVSFMQMMNAPELDDAFHARQIQGLEG